METHRDIPKFYLNALDICRKAFGETKIELLEENLRRTSPTEHYELGHLGANILIENTVKIFLTCQIAEDICVYGLHIAEDIIFKSLKEAGLLDEILKEK